MVQSLLGFYIYTITCDSTLTQVLVFLLIPNNILYMPVLNFSVSSLQLFLVIAFLTLLINFQKFLEGCLSFWKIVALTAYCTLHAYHVYAHIHVRFQGFYFTRGWASEKSWRWLRTVSLHAYHVYAHIHVRFQGFYFTRGWASEKSWLVLRTIWLLDLNVYTHTYTCGSKLTCD
jgi:hypothetical protein